ncbi:bacterial transferase hexapeptide family protein [Neorickettsia helminthoeca str. Oregon]|uniref:Bacterial transferase hexapeptide family protein n=1 Tax=Neorickettsia helminthoeca str. Oregon TaxID=1286528 RepID=X5H3N5_9RICK|nr:2,3,4,5-tetrahydropyridine-2,6-dicarboxylate N-succinyltransferase [Neorickettsia helminthoeca]AHX11308.1 bacterial transferase hexapeptide family protein [Neorickettsia helminthoeca str. Oregon]
MDIAEYKSVIEDAWESSNYSDKSLLKSIEAVIQLIEMGKLRVAEKQGSSWETNQWVKQAILIYMRISENKLITYGQPESSWFDKIDQRFMLWQEEDFSKAKIRAVPGSFVRKSAYIGTDVVIMPSFINVGAYVGAKTMIDTWASIGSCAQIGKNCHIAGGVGIGGVLEPLASNPVIIEDNCFIGARSEIVDGVLIGEGSVLAMGCYIGPSTRIVDRATNKVTYGSIPPYSVVVPGSIQLKDGISISCVIIVKQVDEKTRAKVQINQLLRFQSTAPGESLS